MQKYVHLVDLLKRFPTNIYLQNLASIQKRTSPVKFAHLAEKSANGSISNLSTKAESAADELQQLTARKAELEASVATLRKENEQLRRNMIRLYEHAEAVSDDNHAEAKAERQRIAFLVDAVSALVERFDIEPFPDFSAK